MSAGDPPGGPAARRWLPAGLQRIIDGFASWRTASVALLSFSQGLPLGLIWIAIPDWLRQEGVDIRVVGLLTLAQAPWTFKMLWSPLMDRFAPPFLDRRRGWAVITQVMLFALGLVLAGVATQPEAPWVIAAVAFVMAFAGASQDIAVDAYAVEVLRREEQGAVVGARVGLYRWAMFVAGGFAISAAGEVGWPMVNVLLACAYLPMMLVTIKAPPAVADARAPRTLTQAVWQPFLGFLARHRALEILAFVFLYKFADNLAQSLLRPFLVDMGYSDWDRGAGMALVSLIGIVGGTFLGGFLTTGLGLGHSLWLFGFIQIFSNVGYILLARSEVNRPLMYGAMSFETFCQGLGTGAFSVLLLRMTQKRFSATQYALFSSLFGLPRVVAGPMAGFSVDALGWEVFFWISMAAGVPGLLMLQRFVPLGTREPAFTVRPPSHGAPLSRAALTLRGLGGAAAGFAGGGLISATLTALKGMRGDQARSFDLVAPLLRLLAPADMGDWMGLLGLLIFAAVCGLGTAAIAAARHGAARDLTEETAGSG